MVEPSAWNVLLIDDEPDNLGVVEHILRFHDAKVRTAASGYQGLEMLKDERPTFVLLDIQMPVVSGWEVLDTIRSDPQLQDLTVIALSAHIIFSPHEEKLKQRFDGFLPKPISAFTFIGELQDILQRGTSKKTIIPEGDFPTIQQSQ